MKPCINWGVLGTANIAVRHALPAMRSAPSARLLALASRDVGKARAVATTLGVPRVHDDYAALLADPEIDAVYLPLPNALHFEWSVRALEAGKHVLCEKPVCVSSAQVRELCAVRDRCGRHVEEAFAFRNHPQWQAVAAIAAAGKLGALRAVHGTIAKQFFDPADIRNQPDGGGALYDMGSYAITACQLLFGRRPRRVIAAIDTDPIFTTDRLSTALLDYGDAHASFTVATQSGGSGWGSQQNLFVLFAAGWMRLDFPYSQVRPTACRIEVGETGAVGGLPTRTLDFDPVDQFALQAERFSRLLLGDAVAPWPIEGAGDTLETIECLFASARSGGWIDLPPR